MRSLISYTVEGRVNMHRTIDQFVFNFYVKERLDFNSCYSAFLKHVAFREAANYNQGWFTKDRLMQDMESVWNKFEKNKEKLLDKNIRGSNLLEIVMGLFKKSEKQDIFVSQAACARVLGTNQMAISRELKDMIKDGVLSLVERGSKISGKCSTYSISEKGLKLFSQMFKATKEIMVKIVEKSNDALDRLKQQLDILRANARIDTTKLDTRDKREKEIEYLYKRREILL